MPAFDTYTRSHARPDFLVIQAGSNDLGVLKTKELIENIKLDIMRIVLLFPDIKIVWSDALPRRYWHFADNHDAVETSRKRLNMALRKYVKELANGHTISHPNIKESERALYRFDGVHLSDVGNDIYLNNIQAAFELFLEDGAKSFPQNL